jgi:phenylpropionate dioxygenase-like ring-hydroxylating dioxygenase large terminal subunit
MIPNQWYVVLNSKEVKQGKPSAFKRLGIDLVFWRNEAGKVVAMEDRCPHRQVKLSLGKIKDNCIECPFHGFRYDSEGACQLIPANGRNGVRPKIFHTNNFPVQEKYGFIWLWYGEERGEYPPVNFYDEEVEGLIYASFETKWKVNYTRAIENQLDVAHLPFIHSNTIGAGGETFVRGPYTELNDNTIYVWISNEKDKGQILQKLSETEKPQGNWGVSFKFPNLWMLWLGENYKLMIAFVPVDEETTLMYLRTYVKEGKFKPLTRIIAEASSQANRPVLWQDYRVVRSMPKAGGFESGDKYIAADRPIVLYYNHRKKLIEQAGQKQPLVVETLERQLAG